MTLFNKLLSKTASTVHVPKLRIYALMFALMQMQQLQPTSFVEATDPSCATPPGTIDEPVSALGPALYLAKGTADIKSVSFSLFPASFVLGESCGTAFASFSLIHWDGCSGEEVAKSVFKKSFVYPDGFFYSAVARYYPKDSSWRHPPKSAVDFGPPYDNRYPDTDGLWPRGDEKTGTSMRVTYTSNPDNPSQWKQQFEASLLDNGRSIRPNVLFKKPEFCDHQLKRANSFMFSLRAIPKDHSKGLYKAVTLRYVEFYDITIVLSQGDQSFTDAFKSIGGAVTWGDITHDGNYQTWTIPELHLPTWHVCGPGETADKDECIPA